MVVLGLPGDLLAVIATYTTEQATYRTLRLSRDTATLAYRSEYLWRAKVLFELKGLIVDPKIVAGRWAAYYRIANQTFYGRLEPVWKGSGTILPLTVSVIARTDSLIIAWQPASSQLLVIKGAPPFNIVKRIPYLTPIRKIVPIPEVGKDQVLLLDERGAVSTFDPMTATLDLIRPSSDVVDIGALSSFGSPFLTLDRSGELSREGRRILTHTSRIVAFNNLDAIDRAGDLTDLTGTGKGPTRSSPPMVVNYVDLDYNVYTSARFVVGKGIFGEGDLNLYFIVDPNRRLLVIFELGSLVRWGSVGALRVQKCVVYAQESVLITDLP